jgi:DNA invertase Pin-like site-specific DNA recombinase
MVSRNSAATGFPRKNGWVRQLGYTRVSTAGQDAQLQVDALLAAGVQKRDVFDDVTSGSRNAIDWPGMRQLLQYAEPGDTVVVWRVDRLGRFLVDVLNTVNLLRDRDVQVKSIADGIDPSTPTGRLMLNLLATVNDVRAKGRTAADAARLVGWSRATLYRHQQQLSGNNEAPDA